MIHLTYDATIDYLNRAVAERGADHHADDIYFETDDEGRGTPCCIVGHVMAYAGLDINSADYEGEFPLEGMGVHYLDDVLTYDSDRTYTLLLRAQQLQDQGVSWGRAVDEAKRVAEDEKTEAEEA